MIFLGDGICYRYVFAYVVYVFMSTYMCVLYCHLSVYRYVYMSMCVLVSKCVLYACVAGDNFGYVLLFAAFDVNNKPKT